MVSQRLFGLKVLQGNEMILFFLQIHKEVIKLLAIVLIGILEQTQTHTEKHKYLFLMIEDTDLYDLNLGYLFNSQLPVTFLYSVLRF
jgi:hypothetical protein